MAREISWWRRLQDEHPGLQDCLSYMRNPRLFPLYPTAIILVASVGSTIFSGDPERRNMSALWSEISEGVASLIGNTWFQAVYLGAAFYAIFWAARDMLQKQEKRLEKETEIRREVFNEFRAEYPLLGQIPKLALLSRQADLLQGRSRSLEDAIHCAEAAINTTSSGDRARTERDFERVIQQVASLTKAPPGVEWPAPPNPPSTKIPAQICEKQNLGGGHDGYRFDPERADNYLQGLRDYLKMVEDWKGNLGKCEDELQAELVELLGKFGVK